MKVRHLLSQSLLVALAILLPCLSLFAQSNKADNGMANMMYSSGKIYVVIGVILLIFIGIVFYLVALDRRIGRMEDEL
ncbi:MAG: CcmD family protein [Chitinophagales bacterium]